MVTGEKLIKQTRPPQKKGKERKSSDQRPNNKIKDFKHTWNIYKNRLCFRQQINNEYIDTNKKTNKQNKIIPFVRKQNNILLNNLCVTEKIIKKF